MRDETDGSSRASEPKDHPRFSEYLTECNAFWEQKEKVGPAATFPSFQDWLADKERKVSDEPRDEPKAQQPPPRLSLIHI